MGQAELKQLHAAKEIEFDFAKADVYVSEDQRILLRTRHDEEIILRQAAHFLAQPDRPADQHALSTGLQQAANARFGLTDREGRLVMESTTPPAEGAINYAARAVKHIVRVVAQTKFPKPDEILKADRARYRKWQRCIDYDRPDQALLRVADVEWLRALLDADKIGLSIEESDWAEGTRDYCEVLLKQALEPEGGA